MKKSELNIKGTEELQKAVAQELENEDDEKDFERLLESCGDGEEGVEESS